MKKIFYRWLAKGRLLRRYDYLNEVNRILEEYITNRIISSESQAITDQARKDLILKQNEIRETETLVAFLKKLRIK